MNEEELLAQSLKALAGPCDTEGALRQIRGKVDGARRRRVVRRGVGAVAVCALVFLAGWWAWQELGPAPVVVITDDYEVDGAFVPATTAAGAAAAGVPVPVPVEMVTSIAGAAELIGPRLAIPVATFEWGSEAGRFGRDGDGTGRGPTVFATAPDTQFIAVLDSANNRVQMLEPGGGWRSSPAPLPEGGPFVDVAICADGNLALLAAGEVVLVTLDGEVLGRHVIGWDRFLPEHLFRSGPDLWITGTQQTAGADGKTRSYPFLLNGEVQPPEAAAAGARDGWVTAGATFEPVQHSSALLQVRITPDEGQPLLWSIVSELPLDSYRPLGSDAAGNYYLAVLVGSPGGEPAEASWCVVGLTPAGGQLGQVRWPGAYEVGGGFEVSSDGQVYDFQGRADGLHFVRYGLETDVAYVIQPAENLVQGYLEALEARLLARGIEVISMTTDTGDPADTQLAASQSPPGDVLPLVCVRVPAATLASPDGIFRRAAIEHEALYMVRHGVPLRILAVVSVNDDGSEQGEGLGMLGDLAYSNEWDLPGTVGEEESRAVLEQALREAATQAGATLVTLDLDLDDDGFHPHLVVSVGGSVSAQIAQVSDRVLQAVNDLAERGVKIPVFNLSVNSQGGEPLLRSCSDWTIGGGSYSRWTAPGVEMGTRGHPYISQPVPAPETTE